VIAALTADLKGFIKSPEEPKKSTLLIKPLTSRLIKPPSLRLQKKGNVQRLVVIKHQQVSKARVAGKAGTAACPSRATFLRESV
jgi:hypothetical protein